MVRELDVVSQSRLPIAPPVEESPGQSNQTDCYSCTTRLVKAWSKHDESKAHWPLVYGSIEAGSRPCQSGPKWECRLNGCCISTGQSDAYWRYWRITVRSGKQTRGLCGSKSEVRTIVSPFGVKHDACRIFTVSSIAWPKHHQITQTAGNIGQWASVL
jgi:hypothetical protein